MVGEKPERERGGASNLEYTTFISCRGRTKHVRKEGGISNLEF